MNDSGQDDARRATLRAALAALHAGRFEDAARLAEVYAAGHSDTEAALLHALGLGAAGRFTQAAPLLDAVARARPGHAHPVRDLALLLRGRGQVDDAAAAIHAVLALDPAQPALGAVLAELGDHPGAIACFEATIAADPGSAAAWTNLGQALAAAGRFDDAIAAHDRAVALTPTPQIELNRVMTLLKAGRFAEGFAAWQFRHTAPGAAALPSGPRLDRGQPVARRTILLVHEEGFGDTIMLIRYAALLAARGARVAALVPPPLQRLIATMPGVVSVAKPGDPLPSYDRVAPMLDLPGIFGTEPATIPAPIPYLQVEPARITLPGLRVGLCWAGGARADAAAQITDPQRSLAPAVLAPLLAVPGISCVSLQWGAPCPPGVIPGLDGAQDFLDTARIVAGLDLVISVDTAVAHLAGALGKPVLLLDRYDHCWRWQHGQDITPWYPTMRILRQHRAGDWAPVIARAAEALAVRAKACSVRAGSRGTL